MDENQEVSTSLSCSRSSKQTNGAKTYPAKAKSTKTSGNNPKSGLFKSKVSKKGSPSKQSIVMKKVSPNVFNGEVQSPSISAGGTEAISSQRIELFVFKEQVKLEIMKSYECILISLKHLKYV